MPIPEFARMQGFLGLESRQAHAAPADAAPSSPAPEAPPKVPAPLRAAPRGAAVLLIALAGACSRPGAPPSTSPPSSTAGASDFLLTALDACRETCAPRDPAWTASAVAGAVHVRCSCTPLPGLGTAPAVRGQRGAARAPKAARLQASAGPEARVAAAEVTP